MVVELVSLQWLIGIVMIPGGGALVSILWLLRVVRNEQCSQHADTVKLLRDVIHYMRWGVEKMVGEKPPPPIAGE